MCCRYLWIRVIHNAAHWAYFVMEKWLNIMKTMLSARVLRRETNIGKKHLTNCKNHGLIYVMFWGRRWKSASLCLFLSQSVRVCVLCIHPGRMTSSGWSVYRAMPASCEPPSLRAPQCTQWKSEGEVRERENWFL